MQERVALLAGATTPDAGKRPQPFVMHKMAFHRGRVLGIIRRTLHNSLPANAEAQAGARMCPLLASYHSLWCQMRICQALALSSHLRNPPTCEVCHWIVI